MGFFDDVEEALDAQQQADKEASEAPKFDPKPGDVLQGVLLGAEYFDKGQFDPTILVTFRNVGSSTVGGIEAGKSGVMWLPTVARRKFISAAPAVGSPFALQYVGKVVPEKGGNEYKDWTIVTPFTKDGDEHATDRELWDGLHRRLEAMPTRSGGSGNHGGGDDWQF